jgi:hypothetical protein
MTELFADRNTARRNLQRELDRVGTIVSKVEWLVAHRRSEFGAALP